MGSPVGASSAYPSRTEVLVTESPASDPLSDIFYLSKCLNFQVRNIPVIDPNVNGMMAG